MVKQKQSKFLKTGFARCCLGVWLLLLYVGLGLHSSYANVGTEMAIADYVPFQSQITGSVTDADGIPLPGATILEMGTTNGTQTDFDGNFTIEVPEDATLVVSYIGYAKQEIPVNGQTTINVTMQEDANQLDEVVLVGYGTQSRVSVTNAISSVSNEDLVETATVDVTQALQGLSLIHI